LELHLEGFVLLSLLLFSGDFLFSQLNIGARDRRESLLFKADKGKWPSTQTIFLSRQNNEILLLTCDSLAS
jgi:hypothetical protein